MALHFAPNQLILPTASWHSLGKPRMSRVRGRSVPLSLPRRFIGDLVYFAHRVPSVPVERTMKLSELVAARNSAQPRPSWCAMFVKAFALVAQRMPFFRCAYMGFPVAHLYEHPFSVASIAIERRYRDEEGVFFAHLKCPEAMSLEEIDHRLRHVKEAPVDEIGSFRHSLLITRLPWPLRWVAWWFGLNVWGRKRAHYLGTFGVSVYAALGAASLHPLSPLTATLNYGVLQPDGSMSVRIVYDHRVLDGATVARGLRLLEGILKNEVLGEIRSDLRQTG
jgi:hypothetical protein